MNSLPLVLIFVLSALSLAAQLPYEPLVRSEGEFTYDPNAPNGPADWGDIKPEFATCGTGTSQSPINFPCDVTAESVKGNPSVGLKETELEFKRTTENFELDCENVGTCGKTTFKGVRYDLVNLHFHAPSEHLLNGVQFPLESHMVHRAASGALLVIATMYEKRAARDYLEKIKESSGLASKENEVFASILDNINNGNTVFDVEVDGLIGNEGYCTYSGSLTTPPCTEGVTWLLALEKQKITSAQVADYEAITGSGTFGNNRPVQPLNDREVTCFIKPSDDDDSDDDDSDDDRR